MDEIAILEIVNRRAYRTYCFAQTSHRKWGSEDAPTEHGLFYQLMPSDEGQEEDGFFEWYCEAFPFEQFFETKEACALVFLDKLLDWQYPSS